ncbi:MAG: sugar transferase [Candidatus Binatia bacterium]
MRALEAVAMQSGSEGPALDHVHVAGLRPDGTWGRWWQVAIAAVGFVVLLPVTLLIAFGVKLTSRGPVLYKGTRIGRNLEPFTIYKFRTLLVDAEQRIGGRLLSSSDALYTPIGRFLRKTKLDEIPQLWNIVRGDMNLAGPRPVRPVFLATSLRDIANYAARFVVRPGMTGLAQLRGGYFTHPRDKLRYDVLYIRNRGMWLDVKLVLATFVKLLNRWMTLGLLLALVFLSASFAPWLFRTPFALTVGGFHLSFFESTGLLVVAAALAAQIPSHRLYLYATPTNLPMACFAVFSVVAGLVGGDLTARLRDLAYFTASGFLVYFLVVSGEMNRTLARRAARVVAVSSVLVSVVGLIELVVRVHARGGELIGIGSTVGSPVALAAYLVLGVPLVLTELCEAEGRTERDFWLVSTTLVAVTVLLTQTRMGLIALWLTGTLFSLRVSGRAFRWFIGGGLGFVAVLVLAGALHLAPATLGGEVERRVENTIGTVVGELASVRGLVGTAPGKGAINVVEVAAGPEAAPHRVVTENMHLTLLVRTGLVGWALIMWVIGAALVGIFRGSNKVEDRHLGLMLWAVFSSGVGFLVSMGNFNAFYNPTIQVSFWGLLGVGMAIVTHLNGRRPTFNVIYRFGQGE